MSEVILFRQCLGLNDSKAIQSQVADYSTGKSHMTAVYNMTITDDGCMQTVPALITTLTHTAPVTRLSAGSRLFFGDSVNIYELTTGITVKRFPILDGPIMHTPLDVRVSGSAKVYKSMNPAGAVTEAVAGTNPDQGESVAYAGQPMFDGGFVYGARAYCFKGKFLQYSKAYHYDLWNLGDGFIGHQFNCLQAGAIPGCILVAHAEGVSCYIGGDPLATETMKRFYPCSYEAGTLYSGFISKALGYGHVFLCADGVYMVAADGSISRLTEDNIDYVDVLNSSYSGAFVAGGKYLAYGDQICVEYDFRNKAVMKRASGIASACVLGGAPYLAIGSNIKTPSAIMDTCSCSFTLPYSSLGEVGTRSFDSLYVTGEFNGDLAITLLDQLNPEEPERWVIEVSDLGIVQNKRIKLPKGTVGSKTAFRFEVASGNMRVEEIRASFSAGQRR
jgi:hypothetical protein